MGFDTAFQALMADGWDELAARETADIYIELQEKERAKAAAEAAAQEAQTA